MKKIGEITQKIGHYRWVVCGLLFFAATLNYFDRAVIGLLKEQLSGLFGWTESDYSNIIICFQVAYALGMLGAGWLVDRVGSKLGYVISIVIWSAADMLHGLARGTFGFGAARAMLGLGESASFPSSNKAVSEWFPQKERALATGLYNSGVNIGAIVAPILVPWIAVVWGWQWAFVFTGTLGLLWLVLWLIFYEVPSRQKRLGRAELEYIEAGEGSADTSQAAVKPAPVKWMRLLHYRQTWAFVVGKFFTDPVWWFFLFWLPAFLQSEYGLSGTQVSLPLIIVYATSSVGSIFGGWLPKLLIDRGRPAGSARRFAMLCYALVPLLVLGAQSAGRANMWYAVVIIALACAAHCAWSANILTSVSDMFPKRAVASVTGIGGMAGSAGGILIAKAAGMLFDHYKAVGDIRIGYGIMFVVCALAYVVAWAVISLLAPDFKKVNDL